MQMDHINHEEIAPCGNLNFNPDADSGAVYNLALGPVDITRGFLRPSPEAVEL